MRILDLDMDYFMDVIAVNIPQNNTERLSEEEDGCYVWNGAWVVEFLENNLGSSKNNKIKGRIISGHNESLFFWKELIAKGELTTSFEVIHVDSHADLGLGYSSCKYILDDLLRYTVNERPYHNRYVNCFGNESEEGIGDYLLFAIAYQWISNLVYCANPNSDKNDYIVDILKNFHEEYIWGKPVENIIQLAYNLNMKRPNYDDCTEIKEKYVKTSIKDPEVPMLIIPTVEGVRYNGDFDYIVMAQSPNYTPASADFIMDILSEYLEKI